MARIRSVKPEFWTDPDVVALPMAARLLFIGCWNHADDYGVLKDDPGRLKLQVLPSDDVDAAELVDSLVESGHLLRRIATDGTPVLVVRTFCAHQKIDKRAVGRWGHPDEFVPAQSPPIPTDPAASPPCTGIGFGTERTGLEVKTPVPPESKSLTLVAHEVPPPATDPVKVIFEAWIEATNRTGRTVLSPERRRLIQKQLKHYATTDLLDAVRGCRHSAHHQGENERGAVYDDLELILRDAKHVEMFRDLERDPPQRPLPKGLQGINAWLKRSAS